MNRTSSEPVESKCPDTFVTEAEQEVGLQAMQRERFGLGNTFGGMMAYRDPAIDSKRRQVTPLAKFSHVESHIIARIWLSAAQESLSTSDSEAILKLQGRA